MYETVIVLYRSAAMARRVRTAARMERWVMKLVRLQKEGPNCQSLCTTQLDY